MTWKLFLDDVRDPVGDGWTVTRSANQALDLIERFGMPNYISFDHDLGDDYWTGYQFAKQLGDMIMDGTISIPDGFDYYVHSSNPPGAANIRGYMAALLKEFG